MNKPPSKRLNVGRKAQPSVVLYPLALVLLLTIPRTTGHSENFL